MREIVFNKWIRVRLPVAGAPQYNDEKTTDFRFTGKIIGWGTNIFHYSETLYLPKTCAIVEMQDKTCELVFPEDLKFI